MNILKSNPCGATAPDANCWDELTDIRQPFIYTMASVCGFLLLL